MIIAGLGNPSYEYKFTRHNIGYLIVENIAEEKKASWRKNKTFIYAEFNDSILLKPLTYVNRSGVAIKEACEKFAKEFIIITDDVDLPFGRIRIRKKGGAAGHNGLRSIIEAMGTEDFPRIRIGTGPRPPGNILVNYVLSPFSKEEMLQLPFIIRDASDAVYIILEKGIEKAMNIFNSR